MSYWDIDNFLAEELKIPSHFTTEAVGMQFLDPTKGKDGNIQIQEEIQVPVWILNILNDYLPEMEEKNLLKIKFPDYLHSKQFQHRVNAFLHSTKDTTSIEKVNLQKQSPYFYQTYICLQKLMKNHSKQFDRILVGKLLENRGKQILIRASNYVGKVNVDYTLGSYSEFQAQIYRETKKVMQQFNAWKYSHQWLQKHNALKSKTQK